MIAAPLLTPDQGTPADGLVPRDILVDRLRTARFASLVAVVAPGGYGKTTLLHRWAEVEDRRMIRRTLVRADDEPVRLLGGLLDALAEAEPIDEDVRVALDAPGVEVQTVVLPRVAEELARLRTPVVVALDDVHLLTSRPAVAVLRVFAEHLPSGSTLALFSRRSVAFPVARLRVARRLLELRSADLAMDEDEAAGLLRGLGLDLTPEQARALWRHTEGWPAGLVLAGRAVVADGDPETAIARFTGSDRAVADYLREEVLARLPEDDRAFLARTAILDRLDGPVCDAVAGRAGSAELLRRLAGDNILLEPIRAGATTFRLHSLLREMLLDHLHEHDAMDERELHRRAAQWFLAAEDPDRAAEHAVATGDPAFAGDVLWTHLPHFVTEGRNAMLLRWLAAFTQRDIGASPALALTAAHAQVALGRLDVAVRWQLVAEELLDRHGEDHQVASLRAGALTVRAAACEHGVAQMAADARHAYEIEPASSYWRAPAAMFTGIACHLAGDRDQARDWLDEGVHRAVATPNVATLCRAQLALLICEQEGPEAAVDLVDDALALLTDHRLGEYPTSALVLAAAGLVHAEVGRREHAKRELTDALRLLAVLRDTTPWYAASTRLALANVAVALADPELARSLVTEASRSARRVQGAVVLHAWADLVWSALDERADAVLHGSANLTMAELRILRFLPTHMSFREVGLRLHVSPNTVKTQARAIYRKLEVTSRSEAVARARQLGLLDP